MNERELMLFEVINYRKIFACVFCVFVVCHVLYCQYMVAFLERLHFLLLLVFSEICDICEIKSAIHHISFNLFDIQRFEAGSK